MMKIMKEIESVKTMSIIDCNDNDKNTLGESDDGDDKNRIESKNHRKVYRPWGYYDSIDSGVGFQVKRIFVKPYAKLSLQKHKKRDEHWVVIKGTALITCNDKVFSLKANKSTYIPRGSIHRLENSTNQTLEIIEIQTGDYFGEDDIIRLADDYSRN